jgi:DNA-binding transcriptional MerR regulator
MAKENIGKKDQPARTRPGLRMKELSEATGLPRSAILHYIAQGLLPEPTRTGPNMAYYSPECIERIKFIKDAQSKYAIPLSKIRVLLSQKDQGKDVASLMELNEAVFENGGGPSLDEEAFYAATGLNPGQVKELMDNGLLLPLEKNRFNRQDVAIGKIYTQGLALGIKVSDMAFYAASAKQIVDEEMRLRRRFTAHLPDDQDAGLTQKLVQAARATRNYVIDRTFQRRVVSASHLKDEKLLS